MASLNDIMARARVIATGMGLDPFTSPVVDNRPALRALVNHAVRDVYKKRARDSIFLCDISVRHTVAVTAGTGTLPDEVLREFLHQAEFADEDSSYISYETRRTSQRYDQLGYARVQGDSILYDAPYGASYTGDLYVTAPSIPEFPADPGDDFDMTDDVAEAVILTLAQALAGKAELTAS